MKLSNHTAHYRIDAEHFDYFEQHSTADHDSARRIQDAVWDCARIASSDTVLDMGSGNGWILERRGAEDRVATVCVDLGKANLLRLKEIHGRRVHAVVADAQHLPFRREAFSRVIASEVLEHVNDPAAAVQQAAMVLSSGGRFIATTPYKEVLRYYLCVHCNQPTPANAHLHSFDEHALLEIFGRSDFKETSYFTFQNKAFHHLRLSPLLRFLPWRAWRVIDRFFTLVSVKCHTILVTGSR